MNISKTNYGNYIMFEQATKMKLRFKVANGVLTTEDLWELSLDNLNNLARDLSKQLKGIEENFIEEKSNADARLELMFSVVKRVIERRLQAKKESIERQAKEQRRAEIMSILENKEMEEWKAKSKEELLKELQAL